jgi:hypothetical protein
MPDARPDQPAEPGVDSKVDGHDGEGGVPFVMLGVPHEVGVAGLKTTEGMREILP